MKVFREDIYNKSGIENKNNENNNKNCEINNPWLDVDRWRREFLSLIWSILVWNILQESDYQAYENKNKNKKISIKDIINRPIIETFSELWFSDQIELLTWLKWFDISDFINNKQEITFSKNPNWLLNKINLWDLRMSSVWAISVKNWKHNKIAYQLPENVSKNIKWFIKWNFYFINQEWEFERVQVFNWVSIYLLNNSFDNDSDCIDFKRLCWNWCIMPYDLMKKGDLISLLLENNSIHDWVSLNSIRWVNEELIRLWVQIIETLSSLYKISSWVRSVEKQQLESLWVRDSMHLYWKALDITIWSWDYSQVFSFLEKIWFKHVNWSKNFMQKWDIQVLIHWKWAKRHLHIEIDWWKKVKDNIIKKWQLKHKESDNALFNSYNYAMIEDWKMDELLIEKPYLRDYFTDSEINLLKNRGVYAYKDFFPKNSHKRVYARIKRLQEVYIASK